MISRENIPALMVALVRAARLRGLKPSRTMIQKALYLIQEALDVNFTYNGKPLSLEFWPYIYGPYSPDVNYFIGLAAGLRAIDIRYTMDGRCEEIGEGERSETEIGKLDNEAREAVERIMNLFAAAREVIPGIPDIRLWELIASVHYVGRRMERASKEYTPENVKTALVHWKPHFEDADVKKVMELLEGL